jgi:hypothetical protein
MGYRLDGRGSTPGKRKIFLFSIGFNLALRRIQHPIYWVLGAVFLAVKLLITRLYPVPRLIMVEL